jgi:F-type H+-transporting ATPase subunit b
LRPPRIALERASPELGDGGKPDAADEQRKDGAMPTNPLIQPDPGLFIWTIITFLVLLGLLAKFAWRPLLQALETRQESIRKSLDDARQAKQELERLHQESAQIIRQARVEADGIITRSRADSERLREEMRQKAKSEADAIVKNAERQIQLETTRALQQIRTEAVDLSVMIASKIIQRNLSKEDNERLIDEALRQVQGRSH